ncbi:glycosyl hydrolase family 95 catalytic domain-containing protein [Paenibacillus montanisoli]|uniref:Glycoside hydrolase family 95 protein n=1 Tax=Paenibacillus montanisoli TaxID=2081970 RepID=A0A328TZC9_9BACL|nr:glycoside hydrolase family 95 protein [Paenibacillus montanisoli]RAP75897.1 glycoside hydrolase family 95 protein [Paenibacillus montanisoli]
MKRLTFRRAATQWTEAMPLGNGRIGAMHYGGVEKELFQLNEDTLWSGPPAQDKRYDDREALRKVRQLIDEEKYVEATDEAKNMFGPYAQGYLPLGDLTIRHFHGNDCANYERMLDIDNAVSSVSYKIGQCEFAREAFVSNPHQVLAIRFTSSVPKRLSFTASLDSPLKAETVSEDNALVLRGICPEYIAPHYYKEDELPIVYGEFGETKAIHFEGRLCVCAEDGKVEYRHGKLWVQGATSAVLYFAASTSFNGFDQRPGNDFGALAERNSTTLSKAMNSSYDQLKEVHTLDYRRLFDRVEFSLGDVIEEEEKLDTDKRLQQYGADDPAMVALLFHFGRYLLIACSREGTQPANLQGIWNDITRAPWTSNYTLNINTEMNYWPAESTNLSECHRPLLKAIQELAINGEKMVKERYGLKGWTAHHNSDLWRHAHPVGAERHGDPAYAFWPMAGPWLCRHLWEHYEYTQDKQFLSEEAYPILKGAALFCLDWLVEDDGGRLITSPSTSPEHHFFTEDGQRGEVTRGATMDLQLIDDLFANCLQMTAILGVEEEWVKKVKTAKARLFPLQIGRYGQLQEWLIDYEDEDTRHRHISHLYGIYPGNQWMDEALTDAVRQTLNRRGDAGSGWSLGWKICLWSRLKDGERSMDLLRRFFNVVKEPSGVFGSKGGILPNLLGAHPPFQIDGNFGYTAGIVEMIVQSHNEFVELLPALPSAWQSGTISGIRVRGGFEISLKWERMQAYRLTVKCCISNTFKLKSDTPVLICEEGKENRVIEPMEGLLSVVIQANKSVSLIFQNASQ